MYTIYMLKLYESTPGIPVLSLRTGGPVGTIVGAIINPNNLFIEAWYVEDKSAKHQLILLSQDIREVLPQGFAVNDYEVLSEPNELVRLEKVLELKFDLVGLRVSNESGKSLGKITDFAYETSSFYIKKLYATQALVRSFNNGNMSIDRTQIIEITNRRVIIDDNTQVRQRQAASPSIAS